MICLKKRKERNEIIIGKPRNPIKLSYKESHKDINNIPHKKCNHHFEYFPEENDWFPSTLEYFYINKTSKTDGLRPDCKRCTYKSASNYQHDYWDEWYEAQNKRKYANIEAWRNYHRAHNHIRKDLHTERLIRFYENHPEKFKEYADKHNQKKHQISKKEWFSCKSYFGNTCAYCGLPIEKHYYTRKGIIKQGDFHKEHKDNEGANDLSNCLPSCKDCNSNKWAFPFEEWYTPDNPVFSQERLDKINKWLNDDYKLYIEEKKPRKKYTKKDKNNIN